MKTWKQTLVLMAAGCFGLASVAAWAIPITYDFTVTGTDGPLAGTSSSGTFTFDSSIVPAIFPDFRVGTGLLTDLAFTGDGINYDETTANTGALYWDGTGRLEGAIFGTNCDKAGCSASGGTESWILDTLDGTFLYATAKTTSVFHGTVSQTGPVPEPATLALLGVGLAGLAASRWRKLI